MTEPVVKGMYCEAGGKWQSLSRILLGGFGCGLLEYDSAWFL